MRRTRVFLAVLFAMIVLPASAEAVATFNYTGSEQTYTVPPGRTSLLLVATGANGGSPGPGGFGAVVSGVVDVTPGEVLYVEVGGIGAQPAGGFNGGGNAHTAPFVSSWGGGGASDVRTLPRSDAGSLESRLIVAGGGGGAPGGNAGQPGGNFNVPGEDVAAGGGAGTQTSGGLGGCPPSGVGCGTDGTLGQGGDGGPFGGSGGGGGLYGGGGGGTELGVVIGGGGGGSSLIPGGGGLTLAAPATPPTVVIAPPEGNRPLDPACVGQQLTSFVQGFGSIAAAAHAFGVTVQFGINFIFAECSR